jgi:hypothetical protein
LRSVKTKTTRSRTPITLKAIVRASSQPQTVDCWIPRTDRVSSSHQHWSNSSPPRHGVSPSLAAAIAKMESGLYNGLARWHREQPAVAT